METIRNIILFKTIEMLNDCQNMLQFHIHIFKDIESLTKEHMQDNFPLVSNNVAQMK